jgi:hypothetical protein
VFAVRNPDRRWVLCGIGTNLGIYEAPPLWEELVHYGVVAAGLEGTKRLYARVPQDSELVEVMRAGGFTPYSSEYVLSGQPGAIPSSMDGRTRVRRQHRTDVWAIHQLSMATVPQPVQYAEALTSDQWDIRQGMGSTAVQAGWLIEDGYRIVAYLRAESRPSAYVLEFMVEPDFRTMLPRLLSVAFADLSALPARPVHVVVRGYQEECMAALIEYGFTVQRHQDLYVKYTTVTARAHMGTVVNFAPQDVKEPSVKRVPTFLNGTPRDPASEAPG